MLTQIPNIELILKTAKEMGGKITPISPDRNAYEIEIGGRVIFFASKFSIKTTVMSSPLLSKYKDLTYAVLSKKGIRMPKTVIVKDTDPEDKIARSLSGFVFPVVIKDAQGSESNGVFSNIKNIDDALQIIQEAKNKYSHLLVQERAKGQEYRVLVLDNKVIGALNFIPPFITGDGESTTKKLIEKLQEKTPERTPFDEHLMQLLQEQGEGIDTIPKQNKKIYLRKNACLAEGGTSTDVTEKISPEFAKILSRAAEALGLKLAGIDVFCEDLATAEKNYQLIEVNGKPDLYIHHKPTSGGKRDVVRHILNYIISNKL